MQPLWIELAERENPQSSSHGLRWIHTTVPPDTAQKGSCDRSGLQSGALPSEL